MFQFAENVLYTKNDLLKRFKLIYCIISNMNSVDIIDEPSVKIVKKRGRKSNKELLEIENKLIMENNAIMENKLIVTNLTENTDMNTVVDVVPILVDGDDKKAVVKKRGRKPKGGKIIQQILPNNNIKDSKPNVILHLKCSSKDLLNNQSNKEIESYAFNSKNELSYEIIQPNKNIIVNDDTNTNSNRNESENISVSNTINVSTNNASNSIICGNSNSNSNNICIINNTQYENVESEPCKMKDVWSKLKQLEHDLHINNISDKKSACFWCTYNFDNPPVYIPKHYIKESYHVYGCFCSPECAVAYLMDENIDSSIKFERYHFINHIYAKIYEYTKNIKPAPNPYYMLEKFYGNLSIQEYRSLLRNERLFLIVDKPLTRILPELHEDNDEFILNNKIIPSNTYHIKKKNQKKSQVKNNIVNEQFGIVN
jgi:hypothetical protein